MSNKFSPEQKAAALYEALQIVTKMLQTDATLKGLAEQEVAGMAVKMMQQYRSVSISDFRKDWEDHRMDAGVLELAGQMAAEAINKVRPSID